MSFVVQMFYEASVVTTQSTPGTNVLALGSLVDGLAWPDQKSRCDPRMTGGAKPWNTSVVRFTPLSVESWYVP